MRVTRCYGFCASHRLHAPRLSASENRDLYGKCNYPYGHGHDYRIEVSVRGPVDSRTGQAVDRRLLDALVERLVLKPFHHRNLNTEVPEFREAVPTSENLGREVFRRLSQEWKMVFPEGRPALERIRIEETGNNIFEVRNETE